MLLHDLHQRHSTPPLYKHDRYTLVVVLVRNSCVPHVCMCVCVLEYMNRGFFLCVCVCIVYGTVLVCIYSSVLCVCFYSVVYR